MKDFVEVVFVKEESSSLLLPETLKFEKLLELLNCKEFQIKEKYEATAELKSLTNPLTLTFVSDPKVEFTRVKDGKISVLALSPTDTLEAVKAKLVESKEMTTTQSLFFSGKTQASDSVFDLYKRGLTMCFIGELKAEFLPVFVKDERTSVYKVYQVLKKTSLKVISESFKDEENNVSSSEEIYKVSSGWGKAKEEVLLEHPVLITLTEAEKVEEKAEEK